METFLMASWGHHSASSKKEMFIRLGQGWEYMEKFTRLRWRCLGWPVGAVGGWGSG